MTGNQIRYHEVREHRRHNLASEQQAESQLAESARHNVADESNKSRANDNVRLFNDSTTAVNWFTARSLDTVNSSKTSDLKNQSRNRDLTTMSNVSESNARKRKAYAEANLADAKRGEIPLESNRRDRQVRAETDLNFKRGLNETRKFITGVMGLTSFFLN